MNSTRIDKRPPIRLEQKQYDELRHAILRRDEGWTRDRPLDLNTATKQDLLSLPGITPGEADRVIAGRPYKEPKEFIRKAKRYGHIGQSAQRQAVALLSNAQFDMAGAQKWAQSANDSLSTSVN